MKITVKNPKLWSLEQANRYKLKTVVLHHGKEIDRSEVKTGFRTLAFDPDQGFALNGKWTKVKGVCIHHDAGVLGAEFYPEVWRRRLLTLSRWVSMQSEPVIIHKQLHCMISVMNWAFW
ncbi:hypothetical protein [Sphingobacterium sp. IITKGP-BTPF85]|uniref:hypothetical protein n=1 Tax=Sphingobacterium sp. IITKGP-BTPF85 TaxID=1338009 RepID=UPI00038A23CC|nr:hypothetical protein [Sphingobacterium sp. IITKGP-BTPF85]KKX48059.1 hypothetical protein L950_0223105 [Sphingobacterium sp. IITKGP-BTPF85]